jgi:hypothetical protein
MSEGQGTDPRWKRAVDLLTAIGPPITIATALLVYFGWARTDAQSKTMGLDVSLFGYTVQDFVLRSIPSLFIPLVWLLILGVLWLTLDRVLARQLATGHGVGVGRLALALVFVGVAWAAAMWLAVVLQPERTLLYVPYNMAGGVLLATWGLSLWRRSRDDAQRAVTPVSRGTERTLILCLVTLLLFWGTSDFAQALGRGLAVSYEEQSALLPTAVVYSTERLAISAPNVSEESSGTVEHPSYRYSGLRLLVVSGGRIFLLNEGWTIRSGKVVVLRDEAGLRVEYGNPESK